MPSHAAVITAGQSEKDASGRCRAALFELPPNGPSSAFVAGCRRDLRSAFLIHTRELLKRDRSHREVVYSQDRAL